MIFHCHVRDLHASKFNFPDVNLHEKKNYKKKKWRYKQSISKHTGALYQCVIINNIQTVPTNKQKNYVCAMAKEKTEEGKK